MTLGRSDRRALEDVGSSNVQVLAVADVSSDPQNSIGFAVLFGGAMILNIVNPVVQRLEILVFSIHSFARHVYGGWLWSLIIDLI